MAEPVADANRPSIGGASEPLLPDGVWAGLTVAGLSATGADLGRDRGRLRAGRRGRVRRRLDDGRLELDGWLRGDWDSAILDVQALAAGHTIRRLLVGASLMDRVPPELRAGAQPRGATETRVGLALLRDLALTGQLVHDATTTDLDETLALATVKERPTGLAAVREGPDAPGARRGLGGRRRAPPRGQPGRLLSA